MHLNTRLVSPLAIIAGALALGVGPSALAQPSRFTDSQYVAAARCEALIASPALGKGDTSAIAAVLRAQGGRQAAVEDRADEAREAALSQARHADASGKAALMAERTGACQSFAAANSGGATAMNSAAN